MNNDMKCPICGTILDKAFINDKIRGCPKCRNMGNIELWQELDRWKQSAEDHQNWLRLAEKRLERTRKALDKGMEHITGLNNMIESWYKLLQSDKDISTKYAILKSAISAYVENKGGDNE